MILYDEVGTVYVEDIFHTSGAVHGMWHMYCLFVASCGGVLCVWFMRHVTLWCICHMSPIIGMCTEYSMWYGTYVGRSRRVSVFL